MNFGVKLRPISLSFESQIVAGASTGNLAHMRRILLQKGQFTGKPKKLFGPIESFETFRFSPSFSIYRCRNDDL